MQTIQRTRLRSGQFAPGQSGNPGGRPKDEHRVAELARSYTLEAIDTLVELMRDGKDERVRGTADQALLDRGWGKATVEVVTGAEGGYLDVLRAVNERLVRGKREAVIAFVQKKELKRILLAMLLINGCGPMYLRDVSFIAFGIA